MRFAVVGDPIAHSKSPAMHAAAYRALGLPHSYEAIRASAAELPAIVDRVRNGELEGLNVTVPHKARVLALVDEVDDGARVCDAANTLVRRGARIVAYNTDVRALAIEIGALAGNDLRGASAIVIGNGGAARAAIAALAIDLGAREIVVRARAFTDPARRAAFDAWTTSALAAVAPNARAHATPLDAHDGAEARARVVVQATSAGMSGADSGEAVADAVAWSELPDSAVAYDVVYAPPETPFLARARGRGLRAANGHGMLATQGALAFELWLGVRPPIDVMLRAIGG